MITKQSLILLSVLISFALFSCSNDDEHNQQPESPKKEAEINPMDAYTPLEKTSLNKKDVLGKGYDFTGSYLTDASVKELIIDIDRYIADEPNRYYQMGGTESSNYTKSGADAWEYTKRLTNYANDSYWNPIPDDISAFSGIILDNNLLYNENVGDLKNFSFASTHFYFHWYRYYLNTDYTELYDYLSDSFKDDLNLLFYDKIIDKYGTHLITSYTTGLRLDLIYRSKIDRSSYTTPEYDGSYYTEKYVDAGLRHTIRKIGYWPNGPMNPPEDKDVQRNEIPILYVENHGGDNSLIPSGVYNLQKEYPVININKWMDSKTEENLALVELNLNKLIPIYNLVKDQDKRLKLKDAVDNYIKERQITFKK